MKLSLARLSIFLWFCMWNHAFFGSEKIVEEKGWGVARLKTSYPFWDRHSMKAYERLQSLLGSSDTNGSSKNAPILIADISRLDEMCRHAFLLSGGTRHIRDPIQRQNLKKYIDQGGFIFVDECSNHIVNADPDIYIRDELKSFKELFPDCDILRFPNDHPVFNCYYWIENGLPHTLETSYPDTKWLQRWKEQGIYGIFRKNRFIAVVSAGGLQCGWEGYGDHPEECLHMGVNIIIYAMTH